MFLYIYSPDGSAVVIAGYRRIGVDSKLKSAAWPLTFPYEMGLIYTRGENIYSKCEVFPMFPLRNYEPERDGYWTDRPTETYGAIFRSMYGLIRE